MHTLIEDLQKIKTDNLSGSVGLHDRLLSAIENSLEQSPDEWRNHQEEIIQALQEVISARNQFVILRNFVQEFSTRLPGWSGNSLLDQIEKYLSDYKQTWKNALDQASTHLIDHLDLEGKTILLHSNSNSIRNLIKLAQSKNISMSFIQTESRPGFEGRKQAMYISDLGFPVKVIVDVSIMLQIEKIDMVILGADALYPDRFVSKVGSYFISHACSNAGKPVHVLSDSRKISVESLPLKENPKSVMEVWKEHPEGIDVENFYFESVPNKLVTSFITEKGIMKR